MKAKILGLLAVALLAGPMATYQAYASPVTFGFVCQTPANCDGDAGLSLTITLDSSFVIANTFYNATALSHAGFLGWTASSTSANDPGIPNYNGFSTSGDWSNLSSVDGSGLRFYFDSNAVLTGLQLITEGAPGATGGSVFSFVGATGEIQFMEVIVGGVVVGNAIDFRRDRSPSCSGSPSTGCPSLPTDNTDIAGYFQRAPGPVPLPAAAWLLLSGLAGLGAMVRRKTH